MRDMCLANINVPQRDFVIGGINGASQFFLSRAVLVQNMTLDHGMGLGNDAFPASCE